MTNPTVTYVLVGPLSGQTITLGDYMFVDGKFTTSTYTEEEHVLLANFLRRWQGVRDYGISKIHTDGTETVQSGVSEGGRTSPDQAVVKVDGPVEAQSVDPAGQVVPDGNGQAESVVRDQAAQVQVASPVAKKRGRRAR